MSTPTEAHLDLALQVISEAIARSGNVAAAKLIADSEARAIAKQVEALAILTLRWDKVEKEQDQLRARAERAEANETVALAHWNKELERAMKAEAELATERARRDDLVADINDACITLASAKDDCDDYALLNTGFKLTAVRDVLIQYIPNAAMKEGAK
jgi:hypothetical protein